MADLGHETIELCTGVLKRISVSLQPGGSSAIARDQGEA